MSPGRSTAPSSQGFGEPHASGLSHLGSKLDDAANHSLFAVALTCRSSLSRPLEAFPQSFQLLYRLVDFPEMAVKKLDDRPAWLRASSLEVDDLLDLVETEPECFRLTNESKQGDVAF